MKKNTEPTSTSIKIVIVLFFLVWISLLIVDTWSFFVLDATPVFWRGWEAATNHTGKDADINPFKPHYQYHGTVVGDLLNPLKLQPLPQEIRHQDFLIDEYGNRSEVGFLDQPVDVVIFGSSNVSGPPWSQEELVSSILTNTYGIRAYSMYGGLNTIWNDQKFINNQPKFVVFLGTESEIINSYWQYEIPETPPIARREKWSSYQEWKQTNDPFPFHDYEKAVVRLKDYSFIKYYVNEVYRYFFNLGRTRVMIADKAISGFVRYDSETGMLFRNIDLDIPLLNSEFKTEAEIHQAIQRLNQSQQKLATKNIQFITAAMMTKTHAQLPKYRYLEPKTTAIEVFNDSAKNADFINVDLYTPTMEYLRTSNQPLYYADDSHWNADSNRIIAQLLAKEMCPRLPQSHPCWGKIPQ